MRMARYAFGFKGFLYLGTVASLAGISPDAAAELTFHPSKKISLTPYGVLDVGRAYVNNQHGHPRNYATQDSLTANRLGVHGSVDVTGDTQAVFRFETGFNAFTQEFGRPGYLLNRQAFIGASNKRYGALTLGRQYTPYFHHVGLLGPIHVLTAATGAHPGDVDAMDATLRLNNSLTYTMPKLGAWQAGVQYGMEGYTGHPSRGSAVSAAVRYERGPFSWAAGYVGLHHVPISKAIATFANNAPINSGYRSADGVRILGTAARYASGKRMVSVDYSNVQYRPDAQSLFRQTAVFNTVGLVSTYQLTPSVMLAGGYSYTTETARNGISDPARYHQFSLAQLYTLSKHVAFYAIQGYQSAGGKTLGLVDGASSIVDAVASVGDAQNTTPSSTGYQFVGMVGVRLSF